MSMPGAFDHSMESPLLVGFLINPRDERQVDLHLLQSRTLAHRKRCYFFAAVVLPREKSRFRTVNLVSLICVALVAGHQVS